MGVTSHHLLYGLLVRIKTLNAAPFCKLGFLIKSLLCGQRNERMELFVRLILLMKRERLYRGNPMSVGIWKKILRSLTRQSVKTVTKPWRRNPFGVRQTSNVKPSHWPIRCRERNVTEVTSFKPNKLEGVGLLDRTLKRIRSKWKDSLWVKLKATRGYGNTTKWS